MSSFNEGDIARDAHGKFAPGATGATTIDLDGGEDFDQIIRDMAAERAFDASFGANLRREVSLCGSDQAKRMLIGDAAAPPSLNYRRANALSDLGYDSHDQVAGLLARGYNPRSLFADLPDAQHFAVIDQLPPGVKMDDRSAWERDAMHHGDVEKLAACDLSEPQWSQVVAVHDPQRGAMMREAGEVGLPENYMVECATVEEVARMRDLRDASSRTSPQDMATIMHGGHDLGSVRKYGLKLSTAFSADQLSARSNLKPKVMRDLFAADHDLTPSMMSALDRAGVQDAAAYRAVQNCLASSTANDVSLAVSKVHPTTLESYAPSVPGGRLSRSDIEALQVMDRNRYYTPESLEPLTRGLHRDSSAMEAAAGNKHMGALSAYAGWVQHKVSPREVATMSNAGIPPSQMWLHHHEDHWAAGAQYRDVYRQRYNQEWPVPEADYQVF